MTVPSWQWDGAFARGKRSSGDMFFDCLDSWTKIFTKLTLYSNASVLSENITS